MPVVDIAAVGGVQLQMLRRISQLYDVPFSKNRGKAIVASLAGTMIPASTGLGVASMVKSVPVAGTAIGAMTAPALSVGATYVIGMAFVEHFARGGTLLDFEPPDHQRIHQGARRAAQDLTAGVGRCTQAYSVLLPPVFAAFSASHHHSAGKADMPYFGSGSG